MSAWILLLCWVSFALPLRSQWVPGTATFFGTTQVRRGPAAAASRPELLMACTGSQDASTADGSCGYGVLPTSVYPYSKVAGLSPNNSLVATRAMQACGTCVQVQCIDTRQVTAQPQAPAAAGRWYKLTLASACRARARARPPCR
jgi:hypothetical protein